MYIEDMLLNNLEWLICYKIKPNLSNIDNFLIDLFNPKMGFNRY